MFDFLIVVVGSIFLLLLLVGPVWLVLYYMDRWKRMKSDPTHGLTSQEARALKAIAEKLEMRVQSLEQATGWRDQ